MKPVKQLLFIILILCFNYSRAAVVYKTPDSKFSSGDIPINKVLNEGLTETRTWYFTSSSQTPHARNKIILPLDVSLYAIVSSQSTLHCEPNPSSTLCGIVNEEEVKITKIKDSWVKIKSSSVTGWIEEGKLKPSPEHHGSIISKTNTKVFKTPQINSSLVEKIEKNSKFEIKSIKGSWAQINLGWVYIGDFISKLNFIDSVNGSKVSHVSGGWLETKDKKVYSLNEIKNYKLKTKTYFLQPNFAQYKADKIEVVRWTSYYSRDAGLVWFADKNINALASAKSLISNDEFLKSEIFDIATHPQMDDFKIASKNGIYKTTDNKHWQKIDFFKNKNYPIVITPSGAIYVGPFVSMDGGKSFNQYLKYERLLNAFYKKRQAVPQRLAMTALHYVPTSDSINIELNGKFIFESQDSNRLRWTLVDSESSLKQSGFSLDSLIQTSAAWKARKFGQRAKPGHKRLATIVSY